MNRRQFLKKSLEGIIVGIPLISGCGKNPVKSELQDIFIEKNLVVDAFGYPNGVVSKDELDKIEKYFISNTEAWGLGSFGMGRYLSYPKNEIELSEITEALGGGLKGPFKNETGLRNYKEKSFVFRPDWLGIYVFDSVNYKSNQYRLKYFFKCSGDFDTKKGEFIPMTVKDDLKQINH